MSCSKSLGTTSGFETGAGALVSLAGAVGPLLVATGPFAGPAMLAGMVVMSMGTQVLNSSITRKQRIDAEIEKQKTMCEQTKLMNKQVEELETLLSELSSAEAIQKSTEDRLRDISNTFLANKKILKDKKNEYKQHLSVYAIMNIMILFYLYLMLYYK